MCVHSLCDLKFCTFFKHIHKIYVTISAFRENQLREREREKNEWKINSNNNTTVAAHMAKTFD